MRTKLALLIVLLVSTAVHAQAPPIARDSQIQLPQQGTMRCAPPPRQLGQDGERLSGTVGQAPGALSDRLTQSGGVLCPPAQLDRDMQKEAPQEGRIPVIPPPGSPGGDPSVRPK